MDLVNTLLSNRQ